MADPVKLYPPIQRQLIASLLYLFENQSASSKVINYSFKNNKKWGSRDRKSFAEAFYSIVRHAGVYFYEIKKDDFNQITEDDAAEIVELYMEGFDIKPEVERMAYSVSKDLEETLKNEMDDKQRLEFLKASMNTASVFLRVNLNLISDEECLKTLKAEELDVELIKPGCIELKERKNIFSSPSFKSGFFEVQDGASQDVAYFMQLEKGMRVADSCAGAGGKTLHMSSLMQNSGTIVAMDIFPRRLEELKKRAKRARSQNIEIKPIEGTKTVKRMVGKFDRLLLDVPCTGSGTYRRKPESKLFFSKGEHERLLAIQEEVLELHSKLVKEGGKMVYATCSVFPSENIKQVEKFLAKHSEFELEEEVSNFVGQDGFDGFYMARMKRK
ncbi:MAG: RsmB/NOP family class I SAM-dependent RNA methyltransferase [Bdellovibrionales bacterium]